MRVGLVLGAGGVMGGAWLTGGLHALATETGWDPASADHVVGTSAGSMMGALLTAGVPAWFMVAHSAGESFDGLDDAAGHPPRRQFVHRPRRPRRPPRQQRRPRRRRHLPPPQPAPARRPRLVEADR